MNLLAAGFRPAREWIASGARPTDWRAVREAALSIAITGLAACAVRAFILVKDSGPAVQTELTLGLSLLVILVYALPPVRLLEKGFGELLLAIQIAYLVPSIGFVVQSQSSHGLLDACILPLTVLLFAVLLVLDFPMYADDIRLGRQTLLTRLGWQAALPLHHSLLLAAYLILGFGALLGHSCRLLWPAFLTVPFAILQFGLLQRIAGGAKPIWGLLRANGFAVFGLTTYLLALNFWTR
jgi:1,4-dihydroxy-2-naphthoate octaprenyltransferase